MDETRSRSTGIVLKKIASVEKALFLTFDDGPDSESTPEVLDVLSFYGVLGTFFCIGGRVQENPDILCRIVKLGHAVGNHTWSHPYLTKVTSIEMIQEIERTSTIIEEAVGLRPTLMRPPYGDVNDSVLQEIWKLGYQVVMWDVDSVDWSGITSPEIVSNVIPYLQSGSIILHHSAGKAVHTATALPYIIETARKMGYHFMSMTV